MCLDLCECICPCDVDCFCEVRPGVIQLHFVCEEGAACNLAAGEYRINQNLCYSISVES